MWFSWWQDVLLLVFMVYAAFGVRFAFQASTAEKAIGREPVFADLLKVGAFWLPLMISDPNDFNSVEVLRIRQERVKQKAAQRKANVAKSQTVTILKEVEVEKIKADLEATRTSAQAKIDQHRQRAEEFINQRAHKELAAARGETVEEAEVEVVLDNYDKKYPHRYRSTFATEDDEVYVWDIEDLQWVPLWSMLPGYYHDKNAWDVPSFRLDY